MSREILVERTFEHQGMKCEVAYMVGSHRCGYVYLPPGHIWFGRGYNWIHERYDIHVHGGLTFASETTGKIGFDCAHAGDAFAYNMMPGDHMWTEEEVAAECKRLAEQAAEPKPLPDKDRTCYACGQILPLSLVQQ